MTNDKKIQYIATYSLHGIIGKQQTILYAYSELDAKDRLERFFGNKLICISVKTLKIIITIK